MVKESRKEGVFHAAPSLRSSPHHSLLAKGEVFMQHRRFASSSRFVASPLKFCATPRFARRSSRLTRKKPSLVRTRRLRPLQDVLLKHPPLHHPHPPLSRSCRRPRCDIHPRLPRPLHLRHLQRPVHALEHLSRPDNVQRAGGAMCGDRQRHAFENQEGEAKSPVYFGDAFRA